MTKRTRCRYVSGHSINLGVLGLCLILTVTNMLYVKHENHLRTTGRRDERLAEGEESQLGHRHPQFMYTT